MDATIREDWREGIGDDRLTTLVRQLRNVLNFTLRQKIPATTTSATPVALWSQQMPPDSAWTIEYVIQAVDASGANFYHHLTRYKRIGTGTPSLVRDTAVETDDEDDASWGAALSAASDGTITMTITGDASSTVKWDMTVEVTRMKR